MRSRLAFTIVFLALVALFASVPAFSQPFTVEFTGGTINFGKAPLHIAVVSANGGGTSGNLAPATPPATPSCTPPQPQPVALAGSSFFRILGTTTPFPHHPWVVEFVFPGPPFANGGNLSASSTNWELTGKFSMTIQDTLTGKRCSNVVLMSGEYQFAGAALSGWPHDCSKPTNSIGQSPGFMGSIILGGRAGLSPVFVPGGVCSPTLAKQANSQIGGQGFGSVNLDYKLTY